MCSGLIQTNYYRPYRNGERLSVGRMMFFSHVKAQLTSVRRATEGAKKERTTTSERHGQCRVVAKTSRIRASGGHGFRRNTTFKSSYSFSASAIPLITMTGTRGEIWRSWFTNAEPLAPGKTWSVMMTSGPAADERRTSSACSAVLALETEKPALRNTASRMRN
jgi:hypothetical protein